MSPESDSSSPIPYLGEHSEDDLELFGEYRELYPILIEGRRFAVPESISVLRACQYVEMYERALRMPWKDYCWNNTLGCCDMTYREGPGGQEKVGRACQIAVKPGMELVRLPKGGRVCRPPRVKR
jgi:hypothetical protein